MSLTIKSIEYSQRLDLIQHDPSDSECERLEEELFINNREFASIPNILDVSAGRTEDGALCVYVFLEGELTAKEQASLFREFQGHSVQYWYVRGTPSEN